MDTQDILLYDCTHGYTFSLILHFIFQLMVALEEMLN